MFVKGETLKKDIMQIREGIFEIQTNLQDQIVFPAASLDHSSARLAKSVLWLFIRLLSTRVLLPPSPLPTTPSRVHNPEEACVLRQKDNTSSFLRATHAGRSHDDESYAQLVHTVNSARVTPL